MTASEQNPVGDVPTPVGSPSQDMAQALADLQHQLTALKDHNQTLITEKQAALAREREALKHQKELEQKERTNRQQKLAETGQIDKLVADHQASVTEKDRQIAELQRQLDSTLANAEAQQRKLLFQSAASGKARRPDQLYQLSIQYRKKYRLVHYQMSPGVQPRFDQNFLREVQSRYLKRIQNEPPCICRHLDKDHRTYCLD